MGLVAANVLADAGVPVTVLESEPEIPRTLRAALERWNLEIGRALRNLQLAERLRELGLAVIADSPEEFARFVAAEAAKWKRVVEVSGAKID